MYTYSASNRLQMLNFFQHQFRMIPPGPELGSVYLPSFISTYVNELVWSKACPKEAALLATLGAFLAADGGHTHVVTSTGYRNSLSMLLYAGFESGVGKSLAFEEPLAFFAEEERARSSEVDELNREIRFQNSLVEARKKELLKLYGKHLWEGYLEELRELSEKARPLHKYHPLLLGDITPAAYTQHLVETGSAIRLESDGILLPEGVLRQVTKGWAGEGTNRKRLTTPDGQVEDPFVLDVVLTQLGTFHKYINSFASDDSGMLARMLIYKYEGRRVDIKPRPMRDEVRNTLRGKLKALMAASKEAKTQGRGIHRLISVAPDAEHLLDQKKAYWDSCALYGAFAYRIRDFVRRMPQHAIRLAGSLYLAEFPATSTDSIPFELMQSAVQLTEVFAGQMLRWSIKDYEDVNAECCRTVMLFVLQKNFDIVSETLLKQAVKNKFCAADVSVALEYLLAEGYLHEWLPFLPAAKGERKAGRPTGRDFVNPYFAPYASSF